MAQHTNAFDYSVLENPRIFAINRIPAHSDHICYRISDRSERQSLRQSLNGLWLVQIADNLEQANKDFFRPGYDVSRWQEISVPSNLEMCGLIPPHYVNTMYPWDGIEHLRPPKLPNAYNPVASYVKTFVRPAAPAQEELYLCFEGVQSAFALWLNGHFVGYSEDSFTPSAFALTPYLLDGENTLAVQVFKYSSASWLEDQDYWRFSGIFRDVYLYTLPPTHLFDLAIRTDLSDDYTTAEFSASATMQGKLEGTIGCVLTDEQGKELLHLPPVEIAETITLRGTAAHPALWSAETPNLYQAVFTIYDPAGAPVEVCCQQVGFRRLAFQDGVYRINGKRLVFHGVNRHEFSHTNGRAVTREEMLWDIRFLKQNNFNAVRTSHYPNHSEWYALCDRYGLYVVDEANLETHGSWMKMGAVEPSWAIPDGSPEWRDAVLDRGISMLERDKNHPCVVIWSCGNESYGGETIHAMAELFRERDDTRAVHYEGVFHDRRFNDTSDFESRMYEKAAGVEQYLQNSPEKPFLLCEYAHAMGNSCGALHKYTQLEQQYPMYQGGFIWDYIDQGIQTKDCFGKEYIAYGGDFADRPSDYHFCANGVVFADRTPTPKMGEVKHLYQNFRITPHCAGVTIANDNLFTDADAYDLKWCLERDGFPVASGWMQVSVPPESQAEFPIPFPDCDSAGIYTYNVSLCLREDTLWAAKGHEIAYGQTVFSVQKEQPKSSLPVTLIPGDVNFGAKGADFHLLFARNTGGLVSYRVKGIELLETSPRPLFWRAPIDNDLGNRQHIHAAQWKIASLYSTCRDISAVQEADSVVITCVYDLNTNPAAACTVIYTVYGDGTLTVDLRYEGTSGLPEMPLFGMEFTLPQCYEQLAWFARGPFENYCDRKHGARLLRFSSRVCEEMVPYIMPQECGNHTEVYSLRVTDEAGFGLCFLGEGVEASALPYTADQIEAARHDYDLPQSRHTVVRIAAAQCGIGGDDSWGAPVHPEYRIDSAKSQRLQFSVKWQEASL